MHGCAYPVSYTHDTSQKRGGIFHTLAKKVRGRFSRAPKPIDHLGGIDPESRLLLRVDHIKFNQPLIDENRELDTWPKKGASHEDMEICIG